MTSLRVLLSRLRALVGRDSDPRLTEEIATHIAMLSSEYEADGMSPVEARAKAQRELGAITQMREEHRDQRRFPLVDSLFQDLRYSLRQWRAHPGFATTAIFTLALGIGANTSIFHLLDVVLLRPLPVSNPDALVIVQGYWDKETAGFSYPLVREIGSQQNVVEGVFASGWAQVKEVKVEGRVMVDPKMRFATGNYFRLLGTTAQVGRLFTDADSEPESPPVVAISHRFWQTQFGADPEVIGKTMYINGIPFSIAGVARPEFFGDVQEGPVDAWIPTGQIATVSPGMEKASSISFQPMARLKRDVPIAAAEAQLNGLWSQLRQLSIQTQGIQDYHLKLLPGKYGLGTLRKQFSEPLWLLLAISSVVALLVCANLANLLLARATARTHEIGVRMALGAGRGRVLRQLLTESLCLSAAGGVLGLSFAAVGTRALVALASAGQTWNLSMDLDARVVGFTIVVSVASSILFGLAPALAAAQAGPRNALATHTRTHTGGRSRQFATRGFIIAQVSLSLLLVAGASLLVRSFRNLAYQDFGFETENVVEAQLSGKNVFRAEAQEAIHRRVREIPGIEAAGVASGGLLSQSMGMSGDDIALPERLVPASAGTRTFPVTAGAVETMGFKLLRGRSFVDTDRDGPKVAIVSESAASVMFGTRDPIGGTFSLSAAYEDGKAFRVIGVIRDVRFRSPREPFQPLILGLVGQMHMYLSPSVLIRTRADVTKMGEEVRRAVEEAVPGVGIYKVTTLRQEIQVLARRERLLAWLSGSFGVLALILAAVGLYGVIAYAAERRTQEIGVRLALGATPRQVRGLLLREVLGLLAAGLTIGGIATVLLSRSLGSLLFGLSANDPVTLGFAVALLSAVALLAGYIPARRAARMSAMDALRSE